MVETAHINEEMTRNFSGDVDVQTLLKDEYDPFETALTEPSTEPLAVVGDPFSGRDVVLDYATERLDATRVRLKADDTLLDFDSLPAEEPLVIDNCQHLYTRRIGGFESLERFLDFIARTNAPVITGWNRFAWAYLKAAQGLDRSFPVQVTVTPVPAEQLATLILERYDELPAFAPLETDREQLFTVRRSTFEWGSRTFSVPIAVPNTMALMALRTPDDVDPKDVVFERLTAVSHGNIGVATALWESHHGAQIRPSDIVAPATDWSLDRKEAFCLRIVLAKERVSRVELADIIGDCLSRILRRLVRDEIVTIDGDIVSLEPVAVPLVRTEIDRERIL